MKQTLLSDQNSERALLFFAGWGMDEKPFASLVVAGYDLWLVWDYRDMTLGCGDFARYREIVVVAWSFGVPAAARFIEGNPSLNITLKLAVNGTLYPVDDRMGIPQTIFDGTRANLDGRSLMKFYRRMFDSAESFARFKAALPVRDIDGLIEELDAVERDANTHSAYSVKWDYAVIADGDCIIPATAQREAWKESACGILEIDGGHCPDFKRLLSRFVADKGLIGERFGNSSGTYDDNADVQSQVVAHVMGIVQSRFNRHLPLSVLEVGAGTGMLTRGIVSLFPDAEYKFVDLNDNNLHAPADAVRVTDDAECFMASCSNGCYDLIVSSSAMQWFNSPATFIRACFRVLRPGGTVVLSTFGDKNFKELDRFFIERKFFPGVDVLRKMIPPEATDSSAEDDCLTMRFESSAELLRHIKMTGVNAMSPSTPGAAMTARRIMADYPVDTDGKVSLTFNPVYIIYGK